MTVDIKQVGPTRWQVWLMPVGEGLDDGVRVGPVTVRRGRDGWRVQVPSGWARAAEARWARAAVLAVAGRLREGQR